jgi:hypothetical protein
MKFPPIRARRVALAIVVTIGTSVNAQTYQPPFHPDQLKGPPAGIPNEVLVLGTTHLSGLKTFQPEMLSPLLKRLEAWRPTAITTENLSGMQCDEMRRLPSRYASTISDYCVDTKPAQAATGLDVPAATAEAERLLAAWPPAPAPSARLHLAAVFLAGGEPASALVQWLRLPEAERHAGDGLDATLVARLNELKGKHNETYSLAAPLAARLGLERVWGIDYHTADTADPTDPAEAKAASDAISRAWDNAYLKARNADDTRLEAGLAQPDGLLAMYRANNAPTEPMRIFRSDFGAALVEPSRQGYGRGLCRLLGDAQPAHVSNIREVIGHTTGTRLLAIVGAAHKGYFEAYLNEMHDVRLVDAEPVLK